MLFIYIDGYLYNGHLPISFNQEIFLIFIETQFLIIFLSTTSIIIYHIVQPPQRDYKILDTDFTLNSINKRQSSFSLEYMLSSRFRFIISALLQIVSSLILLFLFIAKSEIEVFSKDGLLFTLMIFLVVFCSFASLLFIYNRKIDSNLTLL